MNQVHDKKKMSRKIVSCGNDFLAWTCKQLHYGSLELGGCLSDDRRQWSPLPMRNVDVTHGGFEVNGRAQLKLVSSSLGKSTRVPWARTWVPGYLAERLVPETWVCAYLFPRFEYRTSTECTLTRETRNPSGCWGFSSYPTWTHDSWSITRHLLNPKIHRITTSHDA